MLGIEGIAGIIGIAGIAGIIGIIGIIGIMSASSKSVSAGLVQRCRTGPERHRSMSSDCTDVKRLA